MKLRIIKYKEDYIVENLPESWKEGEIIVDIIEEADLNELLARYEPGNKETAHYKGRMQEEKNRRKKKPKLVLEIAREGGRYIVKNMPDNFPDKVGIEIRSDAGIAAKKRVRGKKDDKNAHEFWKKMAGKYPENEFIQFKAKHFVPFASPDQLSDDELLYEALKEKYGL